VGIFDRLVEVMRANTTPLDVEFDAAGADDGLGWSTDIEKDAPATTTAPEVVSRWYAVLELPPGSDLEAVRKGYRRLLSRFHPDKFAGDPDRQSMATDLTRGLRVAYQGPVAHLGGS
jgi:DnaJ-domain-containing protein 1